MQPPSGADAHCSQIPGRFLAIPRDKGYGPRLVGSQKGPEAQAPEAPARPLGLGRLPGQKLFRSRFPHKPDPRQKAADPGDIQGPGLGPVREKLRHFLLPGQAAGAAV